MSIISAPSEFLYFDNIKEHNEIKSRIIDKIRNLLKTNEIKTNNPFTNCIFTTSINKNDMNSFLMDEFIVKKLVWEPLDNLISKYNKINFFKMKIASSTITSCWFNSYEKTNFQEIHGHKIKPFYKNNNIYTPSFSLVYIVHDENIANSTVFKFTNTDFIWNFINRNGDIDTSQIKSIKEGSVLIFPYTFQHFVIPVMKTRVSIAYNLASY
jgi:hypothetical protein